MGARVRHCQPDTKRGPQCPWLAMRYLVTFYTNTTSHEYVSDFFPRVSDIRDVLKQTICRPLLNRHWLLTIEEIDRFSARMRDITYMTRNRSSIRAPRNVVELVSYNSISAIYFLSIQVHVCRREEYGLLNHCRECINAIYGCGQNLVIM
jgi:hypothetical protein